MPEGRGRPSKDTSEQLSQKVQTYVTPSFAKIIERRANTSGQSVASYLRDKLKGKGDEALRSEMQAFLVRVERKIRNISMSLDEPLAVKNFDKLRKEISEWSRDFLIEDDPFEGN